MSGHTERAATIDDSLSLRIALGDSHNTTVFLKMNRVDSQDLIDALSEYVGRKTASTHRRESTPIGGEVRVVTDQERIRSAEKLTRGAPGEPRE